MTVTSITEKELTDIIINDVEAESIQPEQVNIQQCQHLNDVTPVINNAPTDHSETCSEATDNSDAETAEKQRSMRTRKKSKRPQEFLVSWEKQSRSKKEAPNRKLEDMVLLENPEDLLAPYNLRKVDMTNEIAQPPPRESESKNCDDSMSSSIEARSDKEEKDGASESEVVEDEAVVEMRNLISKWNDEKSQKSEDEIQLEVEFILKNDRTEQLRPLMKKASLSAKAEERFQEHVFEKAKLRKRRISVEESEENDLYIPSQPKLYKKEFVVEDIREMEIDRWGEDYYLVKWQDWPEERNTWEPALHLNNCDFVISKFRKRLKQLPEYKSARALQLKALQDFSDKLVDAKLPHVPRIEVINDIDLTTPNDNFTYRGKLNWPKNRVPISIFCECEECGDDCPCATIDGHRFAYKPDGSLKVLTGNPIYECSSGCKCSQSCRNRVVQKGRPFRLQLFKTPNGRGWGLRTLDPIKRNTFVVEYVGEVLPFSEAEMRGMVYDARGRTYLFDMDFFQKPGEYTIDAMKSGNEARYFNHCCNPNLFSMCVWYDSVDPLYHHVAFFAKNDIAAGKELTINYKNAGLTHSKFRDDPETNETANEESKDGSDSNGAQVLNGDENENSKDKVPCRCNKNCTEYLFED